MKSFCALSAILFGSTFALAANAQEIARTQFTTNHTPAEVQRIACLIDARALFGTSNRPIDVTIERDGAIIHCAAPKEGEPLPLVVRIEGPNVACEMPATSPEIAPVLQEITGEIERRLNALDVIPSPKKDETPIRRTRAYSPALTGAGIGLGVVGVIGAIAGYIWFYSVLTQKIACNEPNSASLCDPKADLGPPAGLIAAGFGSTLIGAGLVVIGQQRVTIQPFASPMGGGLRGTF